MKLPEFITYCTLSNLIVEHHRMDHEWHADVVNKQRLVVENDNFLATIIYTHFAGEYHILHTQLAKVTIHSDGTFDHSDLGTIISKFA